jgi:hypothetical protein
MTIFEGVDVVTGGVTASDIFEQLKAVMIPITPSRLQTVECLSKRADTTMHLLA